MRANDIPLATALMDGFALHTGLDSDAPSARYLWTDAFAVCNFLGLAASNGSASRYDELATRTVVKVHDTLAHFRCDDARTGWLRGPHGIADAAHPTRAGLRIGKPLPERARDAPWDEALEWERDGQYFHYLTRWMHALDAMARARGDPCFNLWARELADTAHRAFTRATPQGPRMAWKMSTDLSRALVPSMGQHDPLDGLIGALALRDTANDLGAAPGPDLAAAIGDYAAMLSGASLATDDPLGLGGLLMDAWRLARHLRRDPTLDPLLDRLFDSAVVGLRHYRAPGDAPADARLAFRELGLAIGLGAVERMAETCDDRASAPPQALLAYAPLREAIIEFWSTPANRQGRTWLAHRDINDVMLATSLVPEGWLA